MIVLTLITTVFFVLILRNYVQCWMTLKKSKLPSLPLLPLLGHTHYFFGPTDVFYKKLARLLNREYSFGLFIGPFFTPLVYDVGIVSHLINSENNMMQKSSQYKLLRILVDRTIFSDAGISYKESKRVLLKAMSPANFQQYVKIFNKNAKLLVNTLQMKIDREFNLEPDLNFCIVSTILETTMGLDASTGSKDEIERIGNEISNILKYILNRGYSIWLYPDLFFRMSNLYKKADYSRRYLRKTCERMILERKAIHEATTNVQTPFDENNSTPVIIDKYFTTRRENGEEFSIETIIDDVITLLGAGVETTVSSLGFIIMLLAMNQDVQKKVIDEVDSKILDSDDYFDAQDLYELPYLDQVVHETWRLYSPVSSIGRSVTKEVNLPNGGHLEEGTDVWFCITKLHRDKNIFPNPHSFNPENFLPEKVESRPQGSYMPFGFGSRKCFGNVFAKLVIRATMCHLLKNYTFHTTKTERDFRLAFEITLKNKIGVPVTIKRRNKI